MNYFCSKNWFPVLALAGLSAASVHASEIASPKTPSSATKEAYALNPSQIAAIRVISRNVLAAKKSGADNSDDAAQLSSLRTRLDQLISVELEPMSHSSNTPEGQRSEDLSKARAKKAALREAGRSDGRDMVTQLRRYGDLKASRASSTQEGDAGSTRMSIDDQRTQLFTRWAQKLEAALADGNENRTSELLALRDQLNSSSGSVTAAQPTRGTPTLQAMPAGFVPQKLLNQEQTHDIGPEKP